MPTQRREDVIVSRDAFMGRVERLLDPAYRLATVMLLDFAAAEDAVHDATLEGWTRYRRVAGEVDDFRTWFLAIVAARCRRMRWRRLLPIGARGDGPEASDLVSDVLLHLRKIPRAVLFCHHFLSLPREEIALVLDMSPNQVRDRLYSAEERLQEELDQDIGVTIPRPEDSERSGDER